MLVRSSPEIVRPGVKKVRGARRCFGGFTSADPQYMCSFINISEEKRGGGFCSLGGILQSSDWILITTSDSMQIPTLTINPLQVFA